MRNWLKRQLQGPLILRFCIYGIVLIVLIIFIVSYPAGLPPWRFFCTVIALAALLALNLFWINPIPTGSAALYKLQEWTFLMLSCALVFFAAAMSRQASVVYLLAIVCGQATLRRGTWHVGLLFGLGNLALWFLLELSFGESTYVIVGSEMGLAAGIAFVILLMSLLKRYAKETERAERLLAELTEANRELEAAKENEKELAVAEERVRFARNLHDSISQLLYSVTLYAEATGELLTAGKAEEAVTNLHELRDTAQEALREMRLIVFELHRPMLEEGGLAAALRARIDAVEQRSGIHMQLNMDETIRLPLPVQEELYYAAQEALNNALKHARPKNIEISLRVAGEAIEVEITDDGVGFAFAESQRGGGVGIRGMRARAEKIGGCLRITSAPGRGTTVIVRTPAHPFR